MSNWIDRTGHKYNWLTVISVYKKEDKKTYWNCICDCGNTTVVEGSKLSYGHTKACGSSCTARINAREKNPKHTPGHIPYHYSQYKSSALNDRKLEWNISLEQFTELVQMPCAYCGKFRLSTYHSLNGLDRVDSNQGYIISNVVPCCTRCNYAKRNYTVTEFVEWIRDVAEHLNLF